MKMKLFTSICLIVALVCSLAACGNSAETTKNSNKTSNKQETAKFSGTKDKDMVTVDIRKEPAELNTILTADVASGNVLRMVLSGLYKLDKNDVPVPDLAETTKVSKDGKTYTMTIRKDAKWSNGDPVTAHDFVFAFQEICKEETASESGYIVFEHLLNGEDVFEGKKDISELGVKAINDHTLKVTFEEPIAYALHLFSLSSFFPMNQKAYQKIGADKYAKSPDTLITNGAYKLTEWVHDDHIILEKNNEYYNADEIKLPKIKYVMLQDANARMNAFQAGEVDCIDIDGDHYEQAQKSHMPLKTYVDNSTWYLHFNTKSKLVSNVKIRKALGMAIDTKSVCEDVLKTGATPATGLVPAGVLGADGTPYTKKLGDITEYNVKKAKTLFAEGLKELGIKAKDFKVSYTFEDGSEYKKEAEFYQEQWKKVLGIDVEIKPMTFKAKVQAMMDGDFDIVYSGWLPDYNDPITYLGMFVTGNGSNFGQYSNAKYDKLLKAAVKEVDKTKRQKMLMEAEKIIIDEAAVSPLYFKAVTYTVSDKVDGMVRTGFQEFSFTNGAKVK